MTPLDLQSALKSLGLYKGSLDGNVGALTNKAVDAFLESHLVDYRRWGAARRVIAAQQQLCKDLGIEVGTVDGLIGPQSRYAFEVYSARLIGDKSAETWRDKEATDHVSSPVPIKSLWPLQSAVSKYYGEVGKNQVMLTLPFPMRIAWDRAKTITRISLHEKVHDSAARVFGRIASHYTDAQRKLLGLDLFGGCLNVRKMRGGSAYSMHSWGIALDFDPERNQLKWGRDKARLAKADCAVFWRLWEEEGWLSLGRAKNYDWMHVQAARLP